MLESQLAEFDHDGFLGAVFFIGCALIYQYRLFSVDTLRSDIDISFSFPAVLLYWLLHMLDSIETSELDFWLHSLYFAENGG